MLRISRNIGYSKILLVTREPVEEQVSTVELVLNREDIEHVVANLRGVGVVPYSDAPRNLWDLVSPLDLGQ
ncbi:MAG TPA: hypothetical protein EYP63_00595 [Desulfotomaculum sp.]|nr:hypothetical protein [Desulfotomaculum sp.]